MRQKKHRFRETLHILLYGQVLLWAAFEILAVPMIWKGYLLSSLLPAAGVLFSACVVIMIVLYRRKSVFSGLNSAGIQEAKLNEKGEKVSGLLTVLLAVIVILLYLLLAFQAEGDAAYMASLTDIWQSGRLLHLNPVTGEEMLFFSKKTAAAAIPVWEAWISGITGLHPLILCHMVLPIVFVPFSVLAWQELAEELFPRKEIVSWFVPLFLTACIVAACFGKGNGLFPVWQGEYTAGLVTLPVFLRLILRPRNKEAYSFPENLCMKTAALLAVLLCSWKAAAAAVFIWILIALVRLLEGKRHEQI